MAWSSIGSLGIGTSPVSSDNYAAATTAALEAGNVIIVVAVSDNTSTGADGDNNEVTSVTIGGVRMSKLGEFTNTNSAAAAGVTTSVWAYRAPQTIPSGTSIQVTYASARVDKCFSAWEFSLAANKTFSVVQTQTNAVDASNGFGSSTISGLSSASRLYFRGLGKEANSTTQITVSTSFTAITVARSRNNAAAVLARGEFRINTSTGETSNPTLAVSGDTAGVFLAIDEVDMPATGSFLPFL